MKTLKSEKLFGQQERIVLNFIEQDSKKKRISELIEKISRLGDDVRILLAENNLKEIKNILKKIKENIEKIEKYK